MNRMLKILAVAAALSFATAPLALAAAPAKAKDSKSQSFNYDIDEVSTDALKPLPVINGQARPVRTTLIEARKHFIVELLRSTEDL